MKKTFSDLKPNDTIYSAWLDTEWAHSVEVRKFVVESVSKDIILTTYTRWSGDKISVIIPQHYKNNSYAIIGYNLIALTKDDALKLGRGFIEGRNSVANVIKNALRIKENY